MGKRFLLAALIGLPPSVAISGVCEISTPDPDGYLEKVCEHISENGIDVSPAQPDSYGIRRIENIEYEGKDAVKVYLDCCYLGDVAVFGTETGELLLFEVGDK